MSLSIHSFWRAPRDRHEPLDVTRRVVVVTDLDGQLFDATAEVVREAAHALRLLAVQEIPLVICSSRTRAEIESLQQRLGLAAPFISENGGALFIPQGYFPDLPVDIRRGSAYDVMEFGRPYRAVVHTLHATSRRLGIEVVGFCGMSIDEVAAECGLTLAEARLAQLREYDEVFRILDECGPAVQSRLFGALDRAGLRCSSRGRFHHATGVRDQRRSLRMLLSLYRRTARRLLTVALAGSPADAWVLQEVDIPIVVQGEATGGATPLLAQTRTTGLTNARGPLPWNEAIAGILGSESVNTFRHPSPS